MPGLNIGQVLQAFAKKNRFASSKRLSIQRKSKWQHLHWHASRKERRLRWHKCFTCKLNICALSALILQELNSLHKSIISCKWNSSVVAVAFAAFPSFCKSGIQCSDTCYIATGRALLSYVDVALDASSPWFYCISSFRCRIPCGRFYMSCSSAIHMQVGSIQNKAYSDSFHFYAATLMLDTPFRFLLSCTYCT